MNYLRNLLCNLWPFVTRRQHDKLIHLVFDYARRKRVIIPKNFGKSSVTAFEGQVIPNFEHWGFRDRSYVSSLIHTLLKLDLAEQSQYRINPFELNNISPKTSGGGRV